MVKENQLVGLDTSSIKITLGAILLANEKTAFTYFSPSPNH
jgi:hypothetical protein